MEISLSIELSYISQYYIMLLDSNTAILLGVMERVSTKLLE